MYVCMYVLCMSKDDQVFGVRQCASHINFREIREKLFEELL
jgi:hypothetical protein